MGRTTHREAPDYWRVEVEDDAIVVYTHRIDPVYPVDEVYTETGRWTKFVDTGDTPSR